MWLSALQYPTGHLSHRPSRASCHLHIEATTIQRPLGYSATLYLSPMPMLLTSIQLNPPPQPNLITHPQPYPLGYCARSPPLTTSSCAATACAEVSPLAYQPPYVSAESRCPATRETICQPQNPQPQVSIRYRQSPRTSPSLAKSMTKYWPPPSRQRRTPKASCGQQAMKQSGDEAGRPLMHLIRCLRGEGGGQGTQRVVQGCLV